MGEYILLALLVLLISLIVIVIAAFLLVVKAQKSNKRAVETNERAFKNAENFRITQTKLLEKSLDNQEVLINEIKSLKEEIKQLKNNE
ncbi:hypothetical protein NSQ26_05935 [Bacillus sp. FSL W7-1360]